MGAVRSIGELIAAGALRRKTVTVRGVSLCIRELSVDGRRRFTESASTASWGSVLAELCVVDPDTGLPIIGSEDAAKLLELSPELVDGIAREVLELCGMGKKDDGPKD